MSSNIETDERKGVPSSSGAEALQLCPGKWRMENICGVPEEERADAQRGTAIHEAIETGSGAKLDSDALRDAQKLAAIEREVAERWADGELIEKTDREERLWLNHPDGSPAFSGKPDAVHVIGNRALVVDYKTGWHEYPAAEVNFQLACNAFLASVNYNTPNVQVALIQARFGLTEAFYDRDALKMVGRKIARLLAIIEDPDAALIPGETQCKFCRAFAVCPAVKDASIEVMRSRALVTVPTGAELRAYALIEKLIAERKRLAKFALSQGVEIPGWTLGDGRTTTKITDPTAAYTKLEAVVSAEAFASCCDVSITKLTDAYADARKTSKAAARRAIEEVLADVITKKKGDKVLKEVK